jgi:hypothetical protein
MQRARNAEVRDLGLPFGREEDVRRLDVAMDDAFRMRVCESAKQIARDGDGLGQRKRTRAAQAREERLAVDELGREYDT